MDMLDRPVRSDDSELDRRLPFLLQDLPDYVAYPVAIVWMDTLLHRFMVWDTLEWVKLPDSVAFL